MDTNDAIKRIRTAGSISISPELFEKIYLSPQIQVKGDLRKTFGNPTPLLVSRANCSPQKTLLTIYSALVGFLISLSPLSCDLMGWRGTNGPTVGAAGTATYFYFGGLLMIIGSVGEVSDSSYPGLSVRSSNTPIVHPRQHIPLCRLRKLRCVSIMEFVGRNVC